MPHFRFERGIKPELESQTCTSACSHCDLIYEVLIDHYF